MSNPTFDELYGQVMAHAFTQELEEIEKTAETYPVSRFLSSVEGQAGLGAVGSGAVGASLGPVGAVGGALYGAGVGSAATALSRGIASRGLRGRIAKAVKEGKKPDFYLSGSDKKAFDKIMESTKSAREAAKKKGALKAGLGGAAAGAVTGAGVAKASEK